MSDVIIPDDDLQVELVLPRGFSPQTVGAFAGAVRVTHIPTGLIAFADQGRSQHRNKMIAIDMILAGLTSPHFR